jgi:hypothetical protein
LGEARQAPAGCDAALQPGGAVGVLIPKMTDVGHREYLKQPGKNL